MSVEEIGRIKVGIVMVREFFQVDDMVVVEEDMGIGEVVIVGIRGRYIVQLGRVQRIWGVYGWGVWLYLSIEFG